MRTDMRGHLDEASGRIDVARGSDGGEDVGLGQAFFDNMHGVRDFAKPDNIWPGGRRAAARANITNMHFEGRGPAVFAVSAKRGIERSVHVDHFWAATSFVKIINILRDEGEAPGIFVRQAREGFVCGVGLRVRGLCAAGIVEFDNTLRVTLEAFWRGDIFDAVLGPETAFVAKGAKSTFR